VTKTIAWCILIVALGILICLSVSAPWVLDDSNSFLRNFVNHEFLNVLGVIVAITLASAANLHLQFNQIEDRVEAHFLDSTRSEVRHSAYFLVAVFSIAIVVVVAKPLLPDSPAAQLLVNGFVLLALLANILVLTDITRLVFSIPPMIDVLEDLSDESPAGTDDSHSQKS